MCYAIPGKVIEIKGNIAIIDYFGETRNVLNEFSDIKIGEYIFAQGGILIDRVSEREALEILEFWKDKFYELKKIDKELSEELNLSKEKKDKNLLEILQKINLKKELSNEELLFFLNLNDKESLKLVYKTANNLRQKEHDNACCVHGILEFSNYCRNSCTYCGIRKESTVSRYRMNIEEIYDAALFAVKNLGFKALVLQSGEDYFYDEEKLVEIVKRVKSLNILIFLSIGVRSKETYKKLYGAGARAVLLRFETSNKNLFEKLRPNTSFEERLELIKYLNEIGYLITTGFMVGLPGETNQDIINNILLTKKLGTEMYSFGPLIPSENTPLANEKKINEDLILKVIALTRFIDIKSKILVTSALETLNSDAKKKGLLAGANSLMINVTPNKYKSLYQIYPGKSELTNNDIKKSIDDTVNLLYSIGRAPTDLK